MVRAAAHHQATARRTRMDLNPREPVRAAIAEWYQGRCAQATGHGLQRYSSRAAMACTQWSSRQHQHPYPEASYGAAVLHC